MTDTPDKGYQVLARKYRPQTFSELIGQDAMVRTLGNAIKRERLAHAFLMTGVRGVGKTSTARLIAKALNCVGPDGQGCPTIDPCGRCEPCTAIAEGRHIDVIEMDAASHTGVDDVREVLTHEPRVRSRQFHEHGKRVLRRSFVAALQSAAEGLEHRGQEILELGPVVLVLERVDEHTRCAQLDGVEESAGT